MQVPCHACLSAQSLSHAQLFATPWTVAHETPLSMGFSSKNTGVGCHSLLQEIFPTQGLNLHFLHWHIDSLPLHHLGTASAIKTGFFFFLMASAIKTGLFSPCLFTIVFTASSFGSGTQHGLHTLAAWKKRIALRQSNPGLMLFILRLWRGVTSSKGVYVAYGR